jgi:transcription-repair coupling factor (superfamily II helicase)
MILCMWVFIRTKLKYNGKDGTPPKIYKLGSNAWKILKQNQGARQTYCIQLDSVVCKELEKDSSLRQIVICKTVESSFIWRYARPNQVYGRGKSRYGSDRWIACGCRFRKTEVAIRAALKAVDNSKQVAILVPTTILAYQHYRTLKIEDMPVSVGYLNRFRTKAETLYWPKVNSILWLDGQ